ncbi:transposable element Tcb1 transposase [Trichonephila clavipes]|nr:transposable element Tcb1 transposase [Trichonephila clavipes]
MFKSNADLANSEAAFEIPRQLVEIKSEMKIGSRVGRNQTTLMWICDRWMQEGTTTDRRGRSHPPQCTTSREERQIVRMAVTDRSVTSQTVAQHIESVTHHSVFAVPFDAVYRRKVCPQDSHFLVYT